MSDQVKGMEESTGLESVLEETPTAPIDLVSSVKPVEELPVHDTTLENANDVIINTAYSSDAAEEIMRNSGATIWSSLMVYALKSRLRSIEDFLPGGCVTVQLHKNTVYWSGVTEDGHSITMSSKQAIDVPGPSKATLSVNFVEKRIEIEEVVEGSNPEYFLPSAKRKRGDEDETGGLEEDAKVDIEHLVEQRVIKKQKMDRTEGECVVM